MALRRTRNERTRSTLMFIILATIPMLLPGFYALRACQPSQQVATPTPTRTATETAPRLHLPSRKHPWCSPRPPNRPHRPLPGLHRQLYSLHCRLPVHRPFAYIHIDIYAGTDLYVHIRLNQSTTKINYNLNSKRAL
jgi:hypothetical protein